MRLGPAATELEGSEMTSFSCPHFDMKNDYCMRLQNDCVPGRPGCVLQHNSVFAVPVEERLREKAQQRQREAERNSRAEA